MLFQQRRVNDESELSSALFSLVVRARVKDSGSVLSLLPAEEQKKKKIKVKKPLTSHLCSVVLKPA